MTAATIRAYSSCFSHLLDSNWVQEVYEQVSEHNVTNKLIKQTAAVIMNGLFNPDTEVDTGSTYDLPLGRCFSEEVFGKGSIKGFLGICALSISMEKLGVIEGLFYDEVSKAAAAAAKGAAS